MEKQTAGHEQLGEFAPKFAELNDDILFGEVWSREKELSAHERSVITITALIAGGNFEQLNFHMANVHRILPTNIVSCKDWTLRVINLRHSILTEAFFKM